MTSALRKRIARLEEQARGPKLVVAAIAYEWHNGTDPAALYKVNAAPGELLTRAEIEARWPSDRHTLLFVVYGEREEAAPIVGPSCGVMSDLP